MVHRRIRPDFLLNPLHLSKISHPTYNTNTLGNECFRGEVTKMIRDCGRNEKTIWRRINASVSELCELLTKSTTRAEKIGNPALGWCLNQSKPCPKPCTVCAPHNPLWTQAGPIKRYMKLPRAQPVTYISFQRTNKKNLWKNNKK